MPWQPIATIRCYVHCILVYEIESNAKKSYFPDGVGVETPVASCKPSGLSVSALSFSDDADDLQCFVPSS